jgi:hypothetical protein
MANNKTKVLPPDFKVGKLYKFVPEHENRYGVWNEKGTSVEYNISENEIILCVERIEDKTIQCKWKILYKDKVFWLQYHSVGKTLKAQTYDWGWEEL